MLLMTRLRACYPNLGSDESKWVAIVAVYAEALQRHGPGPVRAAFAMADKRYPDWFPTRHQLLNLVLDQEKLAQAKVPKQLHDGGQARGRDLERIRKLIKTLSSAKGIK